MDYVKTCWQSCLKSADLVIPAQKVKGVDADGRTIISNLPTLNHFKNNDESMDLSISRRVSLKSVKHIT